MNGKRKNRGAALLVLLLVIVIAFGTMLATSLAGNHPEIRRQQETLETLAQAKQALIAWAVMQGDTGADTYRRPGTLPCPDTNYFGSANSGNASGSCSSGGGTSLGRLPWKSLGIEALRDAHGELLWYAVSDNFRRPNNLNNKAINSDAKGSLLLHAPDGNTLTPPGEELAAVIFAPGPPLHGQDRSAQPNAASSYLDAFDGKNNANAAGPFVMGPSRDSNGHVVMNDLLIGISARELVAALEQRALNEAQNALRLHAAEKGSLPNPAPVNAPGCLSQVTDVTKPLSPCASDSATCLGRLPEDLLDSYVSQWFLQNGWGRVMIYAIHDLGAACPTPLFVAGEPKNYALIAPGTARSGQVRPSAQLSDYLESPVDTNDGASHFLLPGANSNDQLRAEP